MKLQRIGEPYSICKIDNMRGIDMTRPYWFLLHTDTEFNLVCETKYEPDDAIRSEQGYEVLRISSPLDFHQVGVIADIAKALADAEISVFNVSTFDSVYFLMEDEFMPQAIAVLEKMGHIVEA